MSTPAQLLGSDCAGFTKDSSSLLIEVKLLLGINDTNCFPILSYEEVP